jgi:hypothetical protein
MLRVGRLPDSLELITDGPRLRGMDQDSASKPTNDPAGAQQGRPDSPERTDAFGQAIEEVLDAAERELAEIRRVGVPRPPASS